MLNLPQLTSLIRREVRLLDTDPFPLGEKCSVLLLLDGLEESSTPISDFMSVVERLPRSVHILCAIRRWSEAIASPTWLPLFLHDLPLSRCETACMPPAPVTHSCSENSLVPSAANSGVACIRQHDVRLSAC